MKRLINLAREAAQIPMDQFESMGKVHQAKLHRLFDEIEKIGRREEAQASDLDIASDLYDFLQGNVPEGIKIKPEAIPKLTPDQAWTIVWYLGNLYKAISDNIERCDVCLELFDSAEGGTCLDYGDPPYHFCDGCEEISPEYQLKSGGQR